MKRICFLLFLSLFAITIKAQNAAPQVSINNTVIDTTNHTITVNYNVTDINNDSLDLKIVLSADSGMSYTAPIENVSGDVGYPVFSGNNKSITLQYHPDSLGQSAGFNTNAWFMVKIVAKNKQPVLVESVLNTIDSTLVYQYMQYIAQPRHHSNAPQGLINIKDSIESNFLMHQLQTKRIPFTYNNIASENIVGRKPGQWNEKKTIIVDAHFDAVAGSPGADDNGTGVAAVLISSKILSQFNFEKSINFITFDKEESGLKGSIHYVNNSIPPNQQIEAVLNMEMIGFYNDAPNSQTIPPGFGQLFPQAVDSINTYNNKGIWLFAVANQSSTSLSHSFDSIARDHVPGVHTLVLNTLGNGQSTPDLRRSDHAPFWDAGYQALMITDGADFRNPYYHTPNDSLGTINLGFLTRNIKAITMVAATLAQPVSVGSASTGAWQLIKNIPFATIEKDKIMIDIYPNPAYHILYLKTKSSINNLWYKITDITGKVIAEKQINQSGTTFEIDFLEKRNGIYFIQGKADNFSFSKKIIHSSYTD